MLKVSIPLWVRNAAAALCGRHGSVSRQAERADCSRQTVYDHAQRLVQTLAAHDQERQAWERERAQLEVKRDQLQQQLQQSVVVGAEELERFAVNCQAMGVSLRQAEELLRTLLPAKRVPDSTTMGRWTKAAGQRAGKVLAALDPVCAPRVKTLCIDEIFFGG
jgi:predicted DNA-binding protein YlxM (UPF0122 family)